MRIFRPQVVMPEYVTFEQMFGPATETSTLNLPTSGDQTPFYSPLLTTVETRLRGVLVYGGTGTGAGTSNALPNDASTGRIRLWLHNSNNDRTPAQVVKNAENFVVSGAGHVRDVTDSTLGNLGAATIWFARCEFSSPVLLAPGTLYYLGGLWEGAYPAAQPGQVTSMVRNAAGYQRLKGTSTQAFSFSPTANPATSILFSGDGLLRPLLAYWFVR